ncbi:MAG: response regulator [Halorientalis sp.]
MASVETRPRVLVVDDEEDVADVYALQLEDDYETTVAYGGEEALEKVDEGVDAVLLDRRMPDLSGDEVLEEIRDRGIDCAVIMVTAVDPDLNILDMDFDDYLSKPVDEETLKEAIDQHIDGAAGDDRLEEFFRIANKLEVLEAEKTAAELQSSDEFKQLAQRAQDLADELREEMDNFEELVRTRRKVAGNEDGDRNF